MIAVVVRIFHVSLFSGRVLVPDTPGEKIGQTIFNRHRVRKSTGNTIVAESPDVKSMLNIFVYVPQCTSRLLNIFFFFM